MYLTGPDNYLSWQQYDAEFMKQFCNGFYFSCMVCAYHMNTFSQTFYAHYIALWNDVNGVMLHFKAKLIKKLSADMEAYQVLTLGTTAIGSCSTCNCFYMGLNRCRMPWTYNSRNYIEWKQTNRCVSNIAATSQKPPFVVLQENIHVLLIIC